MGYDGAEGEEEGAGASEAARDPTWKATAPRAGDIAFERAAARGLDDLVGAADIASGYGDHEAVAGPRAAGRAARGEQQTRVTR